MRGSVLRVFPAFVELLDWCCESEKCLDLVDTDNPSLVSEKQMNQGLQVVLYGAIRVWKGSIPTLRRHKAGTLITMGSIFDMCPFVSRCLPYSASTAPA